MTARSAMGLLLGPPAEEWWDAVRRFSDHVFAKRAARTWLALFAAAMATFLLLPDRSTGRADTLQRLERVLLTVKQVDAQWSANLLDLEMGLDTDDDRVTYALARLRAEVVIIRADRERLKHNDPDADDARAMASFESLVARKAELAERIKSQYAILSNSAHFLPIAASDLERALAGSVPNSDSRAAIESVVNRVLINISGLIQPSGHDVDTGFATSTEMLHRLAAGWPPEVGQRADILIEHTRILLRQRAVGMALLHEMSDLPVQQSADDLLSVYRSAEVRLARDRGIRSDLVHAAGAILVLLLCAGAWNLFDEYRQLTRRNKRLEIDHDETQLQLIQSTKMSALGQMVAGVAHEINTPLAYVSATFDVLRNLLTTAMEETGTPAGLTARLAAPQDPASATSDPLFSDIESLLADGMHGVEQIASLVRVMRNFSRLDREKVGDHSLQELLDGALILTHHRSKHIVDIEKNYGQTSNISCSPSQINQVFVNIINNAVEALEHREVRGLVRISTFQEQDGVRVEIQDNGPGLPKDLQAKIFDPFFTTKPVGKGTGLGLSICYRIIHNHGGTISVQSEFGQGTTFAISLPRRQADPEQRIELQTADDRR